MRAMDRGEWRMRARDRGEWRMRVMDRGEWRMRARDRGERKMRATDRGEWRMRASDRGKSVLSGVPQGSVLGPVLFLIYLNDLEDDISSKVIKFADDIKVFRKVTNATDKQSLQDDLDKLVKWSEKWQMLLNFGKCKCIHIGHGNMDEEYKMGDAVLGRTTQEKDLGVTFSADMKVSEQCGIAASKGNQILGLIRRTIMYKEKQLIVPLYKAIVRPHL